MTNAIRGRQEVERLRKALKPFARLAGPINGEEGRPTYLEAISGPNGTDELQLSTYVGDGRRIEVMDAADFRNALAALTPAGENDGAAREMTAEEHRLEDLKQMAAYDGPIVSFDVREPYYLASCDHCGWVGSSELCGTDTYGDDSDCYCPRCHTSGADCGKIADLVEGAALRSPASSRGAMVSREEIARVIADHLGDTYDCTRVWSAWSVGTMSEGDFEPAGDRADEIADALLALLDAQGER